MATLYILGNGFDLAHKLPTKYCDFESFLKLSNNNDYRDLASGLEDIYNPGELWCDFETALGKPNINVVNCVEKVFGVSIFDTQYVSKIKKAFESWIRNVNQIKCGKLPLKEFNPSPEDKYLSFNFTSILEQVYETSDDNILHIHGYVAESYFFNGTFIIGHGKVDGEHPLIKETYKDVPKVIKNNLRKLKELINGVDKIVVFGFSYSPIDYGYFEFIKKTNPNVYWEFGCYGELDKKQLDNYTKCMQLSAERYKTFCTKEDK